MNNTYNIIHDMPKGSDIPISFGGEPGTLYRTNAGSYKLVLESGLSYSINDANGMQALEQGAFIEQGTLPKLTTEQPSLSTETILDPGEGVKFDRYSDKMRRDLHPDEYMSQSEFDKSVSDKVEEKKVSSGFNKLKYDDNYTYNNTSMSDSKIIIDYGKNRPNVSDTYIEQESGDFHVNYRELTESIDISLKLVEQTMNLKLSTDEHLSNSVKNTKLYGDVVDNIIEDSTLYTEIDKLYEDENLAKICNTIYDLDDHLSGFVSSLRSCSYDAYQLVDKYLTNYMRTKLNTFANTSDNVTANVIDYITTNYAHLDRLFLSEGEMEDLKALLEVFHPEMQEQPDNRTGVEKFFDNIVLTLALGFNYDPDDPKVDFIKKISAYERGILEKKLKYGICQIYRYNTDENYKEQVQTAAIASFTYGVSEKIENYSDALMGLTSSAFMLYGKITDDKASTLTSGLLRKYIAIDFAEDKYKKAIAGIDEKIINSGFCDNCKKSGGDGAVKVYKGALTAAGLPKIAVNILSSLFEVGKEAQKLAGNEKLSDEQFALFIAEYATYSATKSAVSTVTGDSLTANCMEKYVETVVEEAYKAQVQHAEKGESYDIEKCLAEMNNDKTINQGCIKVLSVLFGDDAKKISNLINESSVGKEIRENYLGKKVLGKTTDVYKKIITNPVIDELSSLNQK